MSSMRAVDQLMDLSGRRVLVTGGAGHIGLAAGEACIELGARVAVLDLGAQACQERARVLSQLRRPSPVTVPEERTSRSDESEIGAIPVPCDLRDETQSRRAVRHVIEQFGGLEVIIHCAGYVGTTQLAGWTAPFDQQTVSAWDEAMRVNLTSAFAAVQEARHALEASGRGSVIFFSSIYGMVGPDLRLYEGTGMQHAAAYDASKGGLLMLMRYLATVLAPKVRVNAISPGGLWRGQPEAFQQRYVERTPQGRMASEEDLKGAVAYLASDLSAYVTGHNLVVDGGWSAW